MSQKKYLVIGGEVISKSDGQTHHIGPITLCRLYGVDPKECVLVDSYGSGMECLLGVVPDRLIELTPRYDGDYTLPESSNDKISLTNYEAVRKIIARMVDRALARCSELGISEMDFYRTFIEERGSPLNRGGPQGTAELFERTFKRLTTKNN